MVEEFKKLEELFPELKVGTVLVTVSRLENIKSHKFTIGKVTKLSKLLKTVTVEFETRQKVDRDVTQFLNYYRIVKNKDEEILIRLSTL